MFLKKYLLQTIKPHRQVWDSQALQGFDESQGDDEERIQGLNANLTTFQQIIIRVKNKKRIQLKQDLNAKLFF